MQFSGSDGPVGVAGKFYDEAENASTPKRKSELYLQASKSYLFAASTVSNGSLKHSLAYLAATCAQSARQWGLKNAAVVNADGPDIVAGTALNSQRLIILAHREHLRRVEHLPKQSAETAVQVVRDMLSLEKALANIGFKKPTKTEEQPPEHVGRSAYGFNTLLEGSYMVLDAQGRPHGTAPQRPVPRETERNRPDERPDRPRPREVRVSSPEGGKVQPPLSPNPARKSPHSDAAGSLRQEIEAQLRDPLVQSMLSTHAPRPGASHAAPAGPAQQVDVTDLTKSTLYAMGQNPEDIVHAVANLLQAVQKLGKENNSLMEKIEHWSNLEQRSAAVYRDIDNFKAEFAEKFEALREMLTEYANNLAASRKAAASLSGDATLSDPSLSLPASVPTKPTTTSTTSTTASPASLSAEHAAVVVPVRPAGEDLISSILHKELKKVQEAKGAASPHASAAGSHSSPGLASSKSGKEASVGIAAEPSQEQKLKIYAERIEKLERTVRNLIQRNEKALVEKNKLEQDINRYVRIISELKGPGYMASSSGVIDVSAMSVPSVHEKDSSSKKVTLREDGAKSGGVDHHVSGTAAREGSGGTVRSLDTHTAAAMAAAQAGGVVSTYRRPPTSSSAAPASPTVAATGTLVAPTVTVPPPGAAQRSSSGSYRPHTQPPRNKNSSATTLEVQMGANLHSGAPKRA